MNLKKSVTISAIDLIYREDQNFWMKRISILPNNYRRDPLICCQKNFHKLKKSSTRSLANRNFLFENNNVIRRHWFVNHYKSIIYSSLLIFERSVQKSSGKQRSYYFIIFPGVEQKIVHLRYGFVEIESSTPTIWGVSFWKSLVWDELWDEDFVEESSFKAESSMNDRFHTNVWSDFRYFQSWVLIFAVSIL